MAKETDDLIKEIRDLKLLIILQLLRAGVRQSHIAATLNVSEATMSRMLPKGMSRNVSKGGKEVFEAAQA